MGLYRLLLVTMGLLLPVIFLWRLATGKDRMETLRQRMGFALPKRPEGTLIWMHAASLGEFNTLQTVRKRLEEKVDARFLVTVSNAIAFDYAKEQLRDRGLVTIAPLDFDLVIRRFLGRFQPDLLITLENEVWPNRMLHCHALGIPILFVNARLSERSFTSWKNRSGFATRVFDTIDYCFAQDQTSLERFQALGVPPDASEMLGNLKQALSDTSPPPHAAVLNKVFPREKTLLAASTHPGEDAILLDAFVKARKVDPARKLILAPRHPKRAGEIMALIAESGLSGEQRSKTNFPDAATDVFLADTTGEMPIWYAASMVTFVAGSLTDVGGHTPFEPAQHSSALLHGAQFANFQDVYTRLDAAGAAICCETPEEIAAAWLGLSEDRATAQAERAKELLFDENTEARMFEAISKKVDELLSQSSS